MVSLAFSPCPNDTFIFYALVHGKVDLEGLRFDFRMTDVEELNRWALEKRTDMIKVSFHAWLSVRDQYRLLDSGSAMGFGNGPLVVAGSRIPDDRIADAIVALPGEHTTAHLLFSIAFPEAKNKVFMLFSEIEDAILSGKADAGVIIHENRFTYETKGLVRIMDLGEYWEALTACPVPLGGIAACEGLGEELLGKLNRIMRRSVQYAMDHPAEPMGFVREHAQEMDEALMKKHIALYVNRFTLNPGEDGRRAIKTLIDFIKV